MVDSENVAILSASDLVMVLLVRADDSRRAMPTVRLREIGAAVKELAGLGIEAVKVFVSGDVRDRTGSRGKAPDSLMARAISEVKAAHPSVIVMTETCLCSYTDSGECHVMDRSGRPDWLAAIEAIAEQAVAQAAAGADVVGPAAMISGSVSCVRQALDDTGHPEVQIMPHLIWTRVCMTPTGRPWTQPLLVELFTLLKRSGADQIITYAAADIARSLR